MSEFFKSIPKIAYEGKHSKNPLAFKFYNPEEVIAGKTMREQLKFALSWWHTMGGDGTDMFGCGTTDKTWGCADVSERAKAKVYAAFEIMEKLSIDYYCFHDRDLSPEYGSLGETNEKLKEIVDLCKKMQDKTGKKLLWGTAKCFDHPRFMHGAGTSPSADVFAFAAAQIKNAIDATVKLGGQGYVFWGGREGYENLWNTQMKREQEHMAKFFHMCHDYAKEIGLDAQFLIEPKAKEPTMFQYDFDAATAINFLRTYDLMDVFKLNLEGNHANLAGHTYQHEIRTAREAGVLGSLDANQGDKLIGWDMDEFPTDLYETSTVMWEVLAEGQIGPHGGLNFDAKPRRTSFTAEDLFRSHIAGMDSFAAGLLVAAKMHEDKVIENLQAERYSSFDSGIGATVENGTASLASLEEYALDIPQSKLIEATKSDHLESVKATINNYMIDALAEA